MKASILFLRNGVPEKIVTFMSTNHQDTNYSKIARNIDCTYSATCKNLKMLEQIGVVEVININRANKKLKLTTKGEKIVECIKEFENI